MKSTMRKIKQVKGRRHDQTGRGLTVVRAVRKNCAEVALKARPEGLEGAGLAKIWARANTLRQECATYTQRRGKGQCGQYREQGRGGKMRQGRQQTLAVCIFSQLAVRSHKKVFRTF